MYGFKPCFRALSVRMIYQNHSLYAYAQTPIMVQKTTIINQLRLLIIGTTLIQKASHASTTAKPI